MSTVFILQSQQSAWQLRPLIAAEPGAGNRATLILNNSSGGSVSLTGLEIIGQGEGNSYTILNIGTDPVELLANNTESIIANRFADAATIAADKSVRIYYNGLRWEILTETAGGGGGVTDHGVLTGLGDDDHAQYLTQAKGDARYYTEAETDAAIQSAPDKAGTYSLEFDDTAGHHVKVGSLYTLATDYNGSEMFLEAWIKTIGSSGGYYAVQGYGGQHIVLLGSFPGSGRATLAGNFNNGVQNNGYAAADTVPLDGWSHHAILYIPADHWGAGDPVSPTVYTYLNGVISSVTTLTNPRGAGGSSQNDFEIGGTDHSNWGGRMSQIRLFEGAIPFSAVPTIFSPEKSFRGGYYIVGSTRVPVSLLYDFRNNTGKSVPDRSVGFNGGLHTGVLAANFTSLSTFGEPDNYETNLPEWVVDEVAAPVETIAAPTIPPTAILYDSFSRADVTPAFGGSFSGGQIVLPMGNLEKPSGQAWLGNAINETGILNRRAFGFGINEHLKYRYAPVGSATMDVRVASGSTDRAVMPQVLMRYSDNSNYVNVSINPNNGFMTYQNVVAGVDSGGFWPGSPSAIANVSTLRFVCSGTSITCYVDGVAYGTPVTTALIGQNAGLRFPQYTRCDLFEVY